MSELDDFERAQQLKEFWAKYGRWIVLSSVLFIGLIFFWVFYQNNSSKNRMEAADLQQKIAVAITQKNDNELSKLLETARTDFRHNEMILVAGFLESAKFYFDNNKLDDAAKALLWVKDNVKDGAVKSIATLRLSSVYLEQKKFDDAINVLNQDKVPEAFQALFYEQKGDVYLANHMKDEAKQAYSDAIEVLGDQVPLILKLKLNTIQ